MLVECDGHPSLDVSQTRVDNTKLAHEVLGELFAGAFGRRFGSDRAQQRRCELGSDRQSSTAGSQAAQHGVQLVGDANSLRSNVRAAFLEQREHRRVILRGHNGCVAVQSSHARCRGSGIDHVGLAATAS